MKIFKITVVVQVILAVFCLIKYCTLKKIEETKLYYHGKKSFDDIYKMNAKYLWANILICYWGAILRDICKKSNIMLTLMDWWVIIGTWIFLTLILIIMIAISLYMITEIKHLSPDDGIGYQITLMKEKKSIVKARSFYITETIIGLIIEITLLIQSFYIHMVVGIECILFGIFFYYFGMGDVLQHENYNSEEYKERYKKMKWSDKLYINNIITFFRDKEYHNKAIGTLQENTSNIKKGVKNIFRH